MLFAVPSTSAFYSLVSFDRGAVRMVASDMGNAVAAVHVHLSCSSVTWAATVPRSHLSLYSMAWHKIGPMCIRPLYPARSQCYRQCPYHSCLPPARTTFGFDASSQRNRPPPRLSSRRTPVHHCICPQSPASWSVSSLK